MTGIAIGLGVGPFGGGVKPFSPASLSPALWLDASDTATITASSGSVSQWSDKSGNGRHVTQATAANQPTTGTRTQNALNVLDFDGGDFLNGGDILDVGSGGITTIGVAKFDSSGDGALWGKSAATAANGRWSLLRSVGNLEGAWQEGSFNLFTQAADSSTAVRAVAQRVTRNTSGGNAIFVNGSAVGTATNTTGTTSHDTAYSFFIGAYQSSSGGVPPLTGYYLDGFIGEVVVYLSVLSDTDLTKVTDYLKTKWGI